MNDENYDNFDSSLFSQVVTHILAKKQRKNPSFLVNNSPKGSGREYVTTFLANNSPDEKDKPDSISNSLFKSGFNLIN